MFESIQKIPLIILLVLTTLGLGISIGRHGKERSEENGWISLLSYILSWGLILWLIL